MLWNYFKELRVKNETSNNRSFCSCFETLDGNKEMDLLSSKLTTNL